MTHDVFSLFDAWRKNLPADPMYLQDFIRDHAMLDGEFAQLYGLSNGGEGFCGKAYFSFWPLETIDTLNHDYHIQKYLGHNYLAIGSDGGDDCLALRITSDGYKELIFVPFGDLAPDSVRVVGRGFISGLQNCFSGIYVPLQ